MDSSKVGAGCCSMSRIEIIVYMEMGTMKVEGKIYEETQRYQHKAGSDLRENQPIFTNPAANTPQLSLHTLAYPAPPFNS